MNSQTKPTVLILGGGYGGLGVAKGVREYCDVTVVDRNNYFNHKAASLRAALIPGWETRSVIPFTDITDAVTFVQGEPVSIDRSARAVVLADGRELTYDFLVIATGSTTDLPSDGLGSSAEEARATLNHYQSKTTQLTSAIIVGDGPVGIEMAGELRDLYPSLDISVLSASDVPLQSVGSSAFSMRVLQLLKDNRIDYQPGQRVIDMDDARVVLENGRELKADLVVKAVGVTPNTQWLRTIAEDWLDERQHIRVADDLRVIGQERIYALGDCSDIREPKMLKMARDQAIAASSNIIKAARNETGEAYPRFDSRLTILPFGASNGAALLPIGKNGLVVWQPLGRFLVTKRKAARLLSNMFPGIYR